MKFEPTPLYTLQQTLHLEELKFQIARCLEKELNLKTEERRERARQLGIEWKIVEQREERRRSRLSAL